VDPETPYGWAADPAPPPYRPLRRTLTTVGLVIAVLAVAGAPLGVLWHFLAPAVPVINAGNGRIVVNDPAPEEYIAADGWFAMLGFVFGVVAAIGGWLVLRRYRGPWLLVAVTIGCLLMPVVAWQCGRLIGLSAYRDWRLSSAQGATFAAPADLHAYGILLVPAFAAAILLTLLAGWSNDPNLDEPGSRPGYGHDLGVGGPFSSGLPGGPDPTAEPAPPGPWPGAPPRG